ncbi:hypothetical protein FH972_015025 [Carpinus fangiana]|uniref:Uncharacterized protein n=1 Tax=Carpinus fangiana TaxID=176857 RepID=A0A5N6RC32_9ROSI|nr:hypothetical protein FH972_015025 [Carpinus fangiana]
MSKKEKPKAMVVGGSIVRISIHLQCLFRTHPSRVHLRQNTPVQTDNRFPCTSPTKHPTHSPRSQQSFLAPPASSEPSAPSHFSQIDASDQSVSSSAEEEPSDHTVSWIRSDIAEILKMPSNEELLEACGLGGAVGITDKVLAFAGNIGMHPETWLDFPLDEKEDLGGMCLSFSVMKRTTKKWDLQRNGRRKKRRVFR